LDQTASDNEEDYNLMEKIMEIEKHNTRGDFLENSLVIVDEAHNLFNSITNGSKTAMKFYDMIMATSNIKILFLTGTPIINSPFEIVCCFNMLYGYKFFPEIKEDFYDWFVDEANVKIKNKSRLGNYLLGKVSYYGSRFSQDKKLSRKEFPKELPIIIRKVPMSIYQYSIYSNMRFTERSESAKKYTKAPT
jgi:SNF2 family DNA or RNA helicase